MKISKYIKPNIAGLWFISVIVQSCTTTAYYDPPLEADLEAWNQREHALKAITQWALSGRIVIKTQKEGWNGQLSWRQSPAEYRIIFSTPLGQGAMQLTGDVSKAVITLANKETYTSEDADSLVFDYTGWNLPLSSVRYWVMGRPAPNQPKSFKLDTQGRLIELLQSEWKVQFKRYKQSGQVELPDKIFFNNHEVSVRLVIDEWKINL